MTAKKSRVGRPRGGASAPCPRCGAPSRVELTRRAGDTVRRTRLCTSGHRFTTTEESTK